jgi:hypothetical protein
MDVTKITSWKSFKATVGLLIVSLPQGLQYFSWFINLVRRDFHLALHIIRSLTLPT